jgi:hemolysin III
MQRHGSRTKRLQFTIKVKEPFSALSHLFGMFLATIGLTALVTLAQQDATAWHVVGFAVYGVCMILVYAASTLYHWLPLRPSGERLFRRIDHTTIYLMIAGTYTPVALVALRGPWGWSMLASVWALAALGIVLRWWPARRGAGGYRRWLHTAVYLGMGWLALAFIVPIVARFSASGIGWLVAGGLAYTLGAVVYGTKTPNPLPSIIGFHEVFHVLVLVGSACHYWFMLAHVLPLPV